MIERIVVAAGRCVLDVHSDAVHNRSVVTMAGQAIQQAARRLARVVITEIDLAVHDGAHPRVGALDVMPFVPFGKATLQDAVRERDLFADWAGTELGVPCFVYGPGPHGPITLPEIRRNAFSSLSPATGPPQAHPSAGAISVGARPPLVAYNFFLSSTSLGSAKKLAQGIRSPVLRALAFDLGESVQVSCNLLDPVAVGPDVVLDTVSRQAQVDRCELVGLIPSAALEKIPKSRWPELDLAASKTIEARLAARGALDR